MHFERSLGYLLALFYKGDGTMRRLTNDLHLAFNIVHPYDPLRTGTYKAFALHLFWKSNTSPVQQSKINVTASRNAALLTLKYRFFNNLQRTYILVSDTTPSAHSQKWFLSFLIWLRYNLYRTDLYLCQISAKRKTQYYHFLFKIMSSINLK